MLFGFVWSNTTSAWLTHNLPWCLPEFVSHQGRNIDICLLGGGYYNDAGLVINADMPNINQDPAH